MNTEDLIYKRKSLYETADEKTLNEIFDYAVDYKKFLDESKTEREAVVSAIKLAEKNGYTEYRLGDDVKVGDKKYYNQKGKGFYAFKVGKGDIAKDGINILAAHIDSPRLDLKGHPLYDDVIPENSQMSFFKTHYYGGIKKYQWTTIPLALHGVVYTQNGDKVDVVIGESDDDPVLYINDLLPHMAQNQMSKTLGDAFNGESMNVLIGSMPLVEEKGSSIKKNVLKMLNDKYGIIEEDFLSAELEVVPSLKARDVGLDRGLIGAYGHDDRSCAYSALTALFDDKGSDKTTMVILADKEEIGSEGISGMQCEVFVDLFNAICDGLGKNHAVVRSVSKCLSADVTAAYDGNFREVYEPTNNALLSCGTAICKFTGSRGKSGASDASAEIMNYVRRVFNENKVAWQSVEMGKVDVGGGGTVAKFIAKLNIDTVDIGVPVVSMHAPYEVISKADLYSTYKAFVAFIK